MEIIGSNNLIQSHKPNKTKQMTIYWNTLNIDYDYSPVHDKISNKKYR